MSDKINGKLEFYCQLVKVVRNKRESDLARRVLSSLPAHAQETIIGGERVTEDILVQLSTALDEPAENCHEVIEAFLRWRNRGGLQLRKH